MIKPEEVFRIGRLGKTHGVHGEVTLNFDDDIFDRTDADYLILEVDGIMVPFFIEEYRFRSDSVALMKFEGVNTQQRAHELTNCDVYFPRQLAGDDDDEYPTLALLIGFSIIEADTHRHIGTIETIDDSTPNILFELDNGTLIPASDDFITDIDKKSRTIMMRLPEGLLSLNS